MTELDKQEPTQGKRELSRTMRIDIEPELKPGSASLAASAARSRRPFIRITKPKTPASAIGDSDFQQLFQNVYDGAIITDLSGRIVDVNSRLCYFVNHERDALCQMSIVDLISGADETLIPMIRENLAATSFILLQAYFVRRDNSQFPTETAINRLYLSGQEYLCFFVRDITLRRNAEERLRTEHTAIQNAASGIAITDLDARLVYVNPAVVRLWGYGGPEELQDRALSDLFVEPATAAAMVEAIAAGRTWQGEALSRRADGSRFHVQVSARVNLDAEDQPVGMVISFNDITERKEAEAKLAQYAEQLRIRNAEMLDDLNMAREVQLALLPRQFPSFPAFASAEQSALQFAHLYRPSALLGGDFFHVLPLSDSSAGMFICDVMGHGMRAALITAVVRGLLEELRILADEPGAFMTSLNHAFIGMLREAGDCLFASAIYLVLRLDTGLLSYAEAGHPPVLLMRRSNQLVQPLRKGLRPSGPAVGLQDHHVYTTQTEMLLPGDRLLLYTDGICEVEGPGRELYGEERFMESARRHIAEPMPQLLRSLASDAEAFSDGAGFLDDVCLLAAELVRIGTITPLVRSE